MNAPLAQRADRAVAKAIATAQDDESLYAELLRAIGETLACQFGAVWEADAGGEAIACVETWCSPGFPGSEFADITRSYRFRRGTGLPGRVWASGVPAWIVDVADDPNFPRAEPAARAGLKSAFCFPLGSSSGALGVIELYSAEPRIPDAELLTAMASMGAQVGGFVAGRRAERDVRESEERKRAILAAALDCVVTIDHDGCVVEWGGAAEQTFGYSAEEAAGCEMAELIVPPALRARHRSGFARYIETGEGTILGRRIEITGMRADGSEFPVELAITRINLPGPPMFTGYLRDITERKLAEAELRASRIRIVDAGDEERRRLERDLHDGAQQRLVHVGLLLRLARDKLDADPPGGILAVDEALTELAAATSELRELARGIHPAVLSHGGLGPALSSLAERSRPSAKVVSVPQGRLPQRLEATAYFVVAEALTNATRYADASLVTVSAVVDDGHLVVEVHDNGRGGADGEGSGLRGLADRAAALDGSFDVLSGPGEGTTVRVSLPCA